MIMSYNGSCTKMKSLSSLETMSMSFNRKMNYVSHPTKSSATWEINCYMKKTSCNQEAPKQSHL